MEIYLSFGWNKTMFNPSVLYENDEYLDDYYENYDEGEDGLEEGFEGVNE